MPSPQKTPLKKVKKDIAKKTVKPKKARQKSKTLPARLKPLHRSANTEPAETTTLDVIYVIDDSSSNVVLAIKTGDKGQTSNLTVRLNEKIIVQNHPGDFNETILGENARLNGKTLNITATIADTSRETNLTSLHIRLTGGIDTAEFTLSKKVTAEGLSADYLCLIEFFKP